MVRAYLYDALGKKEYEEDFLKYKQLSEVLRVSYGKSVEEVADYVAELKNQIFYLKNQEQELILRYLMIIQIMKQLLNILIPKELKILQKENMLTLKEKDVSQDKTQQIPTI